MCDRAFTPREFKNAPVLSQLATLRHGSRYKTKPLHDALQEAFQNDLLFGGDRTHASGYDVKVSVTSTDAVGKKAIILANYSRHGQDALNWNFQRPDDPALEMKVWEAAAATSAAAPLFKPFRNESTGLTYYDGAFYNNNPVRVAHRERKLLWPDVASRHPDIFLSIGTGQDQKWITHEIKHHAARSTAQR